MRVAWTDSSLGGSRLALAVLACTVLAAGACRRKAVGEDSGAATVPVADVSAAALAHAKAHGEWPTDIEWDVNKRAEFPALRVTVYDTFPLLPDAPGSAVFVGAGDVFCDKEPDAFERLVRVADGAKNPGVLTPEQWLELCRLAAGTPGETISSSEGLTSLIGEVPADVKARLAPPSFEATPGGGFKLGFFFYLVGFPRGPFGIGRLDVTVAPDGSVTSKTEALYRQGDAPAPVAAADASDAAPPITDSPEPLPTAFLVPTAVTPLVGRFYGPGNQPVESVWTPSADDFARLLAALPERLETGTDERGKRVASRLRAQAADEPPDTEWERYGAQVAGFVVGGKRLVYANFFCSPERRANIDTQNFVMVLDGGDCYFQVWFDPATGEFPQLTINGEA
jgi:hypothetical protein